MNVKDLIPIDGDSTFVQSLQENAPIIGTITGIACIIAGGILIWKASRKHDEVMEEITEELDDIHSKKPEIIEEEDGTKTEVLVEDGYTMKEYSRKLGVGYLHAAFKLIKLYGPAFAAEILSIMLLANSFTTLHERYTAEVASCALVTKGFQSYRKNVIDTLGEDADKEFRFGIKERTIEVPQTDSLGQQKLDKEGNPKIKKEKRNFITGEFDNSITYARLFGKDTSTEFEYDSHTGKGNMAYNLKFIKDMEDLFNKFLQIDGHVWLSDVYEKLGLSAGEDEEWIRSVGWVYSRNNPDGDNKIKFTVTPVYAENGDNINDYILIDFNVDGNIMRKVFPKSKRLGK